jgi:uncharacterized membrane protein
MKPWKSGLLGFGIIAVATYYAVLAGTPYLIMWRTIGGVARQAGGFNKPLATKLPTAASRSIVKPSPDLLYTACAFDIAAGPVLIGGSPRETYWSMALYGSNTDNFFVVNDRQAQGEPVHIVLVTPDMRDRIPAKYKSLRIIEPPSNKGIALFRYLVLDLQDLAATEQIQKTAVCRQL